MNGQFGWHVYLDAPLPTAIETVTAALKAEGFGVLTTIDVQATLKQKLDQDMPGYTILGACNPSLAQRAIEANPEVGLLLPCNVVVREAGSGSEVMIVDPHQMLAPAGADPVLETVATDATAALQRVRSGLDSTR